MLAALLRAGGRGLDLAKSRAKAEARKVARQAAVGAATLLFLILAFSFGLAAFAVWLAGKIGVVPALGFIGLGFLVIAVIVVGVGAAVDKRQSRKPLPPPIVTAVKQEFAAAEAADAPAGSTVGAMGVVAMLAYLFARQLSRK